MVTAHDAHADHTYAQWTVRAIFRGLHHGRRNPPAGSRGESFSSMTARGWRWPRIRLWTRFESKSYTYRWPLRNVLNHHFQDKLDDSRRSAEHAAAGSRGVNSGCSAIPPMRAVYSSVALAQELPPTSNATRPWPLGQLRFAQYKTRNDKTLVQETCCQTRFQQQELSCHMIVASRIARHSSPHRTGSAI